MGDAAAAAANEFNEAMRRIHEAAKHGAAEVQKLNETLDALQKAYEDGDCE